MMDGLVAIERECADADRVQSPRFNLFELIHAERNEKWTHSALLSDLFNPRGHHGQRSLFLSCFLEWVKEKADMQLPDRLAEASWEVETEKWIGGGFVDICMESFESDFIIVIENKVDAAEQRDQIYRYHQWASKRCKHHVVIYLTRNGSEALTAKGAPYVRMSYRDDVAGILTGACGRIESTAIREMVGQYVAAIKRLGKDYRMSDYDMKVVKFLAEPENLRYALQVSSRIEDVKIEVMRAFFSKLGDKLANLMAASEHAKDWIVRPYQDSDAQILVQEAKCDPKAKWVCFYVGFGNGLLEAGLCNKAETDDEKDFIFRSKPAKEALAYFEKREPNPAGSDRDWPVWWSILLKNERAFHDETYFYVSSNPRAIDDAADQIWDRFEACKSMLENLNGELAKRRKIRVIK